MNMPKIKTPIPKVKKAFTPFLSFLPLNLYTSFHRPIISIPYYHMVSDSNVLHIKHLYPHKNISQFRSDIDYLLKHFNPVHMNDLLLFTKKGQALPPRALLLTFDDGFREMYDVVAPLLLQKGMPATFFINSSFTDNKDLCFQHKASILVERMLKQNISESMQKQICELLSKYNIMTDNITGGILAIKYQQRALVESISRILDVNFNDYLLQNKPYLTTEQINKLISNGFSIGAHSIDHPLYENLTLKEQILQTIESVNFVRDKFGVNYSVFAFPHSDNGVSRKYYEEINHRGIVDIHFGTAGIIDDSVSNSLQRFSLEKPLLPAKNILAKQYAKRLWRILKHYNKIKRK